MVKFRKITFLGVVHERLLGVGIVLGWDLGIWRAQPPNLMAEGSKVVRFEGSKVWRFKGSEVQI